MIRAACGERYLAVRGHAGYGGQGQDIVCAGVSALVYALAGTQEEYESADSSDRKLYQALLDHFSDKAEQERKLSASGVRLTDSGDTAGSSGESLSSTAADSLQRAVQNYLKRGNGDLAQTLAAQYAARMTPAQRQRFDKMLGQYGMTLA